ncbi:SGNH/GDSL hydrolase family protein [Pseudonocardia spinosispora]|uniref:SGNH/GDSL hydrolase family protein n=1 Tax=Pseudonocardia spinosispora TaxID=103441 RepID=UPI00040AA7E2|nr:SGNH/GDSL hydrolase family protein [Pseudonocardia spinosispora]
MQQGEEYDGRFDRYVAIGDSQTEGVGDGDDATGLRGWADRLAERLARVNPDLRYANLAVRGRRAGEVRAGQLDAAIALRPDLVTVVAGVNDLLRPGFDADEVAGQLEVMFGALRASGACVATLTYPDVARIAPLARPLRPRVERLNERIRAAAARQDVVVADAARHDAVADRRFFGPDRLHANALGHELIASAVAHALRVPGSDDSWTRPVAAEHAGRRHAGPVAELRWASTFLGPWIVRRVAGRSSGDGRSAKRPHLRPVPEAHTP